MDHHSFLFLANATLQYGLPTAVSLSIACAVLSVLVVYRRWAFIGEGISHSGFGGAGTAWMLSLIFPAFAEPWVPYACVIVFCLLTAGAIGFLSHRQRVNSDTAIGIFMVASLAWGMLGREIFRSVRHGLEPVGLNEFLFGEMSALSFQYAVTTVLLSTAIVVVVASLSKEILYYCFDPVMAEASGVRSGFIHYLLMFLVALTIVLGVRVAGSVLVTALLVLPGATALQISQKLKNVLATAVITGIISAAAGIFINLKWRFIPVGPAIVLTLFLQFVAAFISTRTRRFVRN